MSKKTIVKVTDNLKRIGLLLGSTFVLGGSLVGCGSFSDKEDNYDYDSSKGYYFYTDVEDSDLESFPRDLENLTLHDCPYVIDCDRLIMNCPNIKSLSLINCSGITDLSFIYEMHNLKYLKLNDIAGVSVDLLNYLEDNGIEYSIEDKDILAYDKAKSIIDEIITDDMSDEDKIKAIVLYMSRHVEYDKDCIKESNENPLEYTFLNEKGVCGGIAYTTNVLLRMAGVNSYQVLNSGHSWNLVELDDEYYYIDVTNLGGIILPKKLSADVLEKFDIGLGGYMTDPSATTLTAMFDYDDDRIVIPKRLVEDIRKGEDEKSLIEKYGNCCTVRIIEIIILLVGVIEGIKLAGKIFEKVSNNSKSR